MPFKAKINTKNVFQFLYLALLLANLVFFYFLFVFLNKNISDARSPSGLEMLPSARLANDINIPLFESIVNEIEKKSKR